MALLDKTTRNACLKELGYTANAEGIKKFQKDYMRSKDVDGKYGPNTDNTLRTVYNVKKYTKNFKPSEFKCECGGKYCCGYPSFMKPELLKHIQTIRDHYGKPITITSGLRCETWNKKQGGSIQNSLHKVGRAVDFYQPGVTDTLGNRKATIKYLKTLPNHHYSYGNGINSEGYSVKASYMGNALHTDVNLEPAVPVPAPVTPVVGSTNGLTVDGKGGKATVRALQKFLGVGQDGVISGQKRKNKKYFSALTSVKYGKGGSNTVKHLQRWLGISQDGIWGKGTSKALQRKIGATDDGFFGSNSMKKLQKYLNANEHAVYPPTPAPAPAPGPSPAPPIGNVITDTAEAVAWPKGTPATKYSFSKGGPTAAFKAMFNKVYPSHNKWGKGPKTGASCDVGVGTVMRGSGADSKYPRGFDEQIKYKSDKLQKIVYKNVKPSAVAIPGDAVLYNKNKSGSSHHTVLMGSGCFYEAQLRKTYFHKKTSMSKLNTSRPKVVIFRKK